jgi:hypothetical protein
MSNESLREIKYAMQIAYKNNLCTPQTWVYFLLQMQAPVEMLK